MGGPEFLGKINIQQALNSGWWEPVCEVEERAVWGKHAQPTRLELILLGRRYVLMDQEVNVEDPESGELYVEAWDIPEEDLTAINDGLHRIVHNTDRQLKSSAVGLSWRLGLLWIEGSAGVRELQAYTTVDY